MRLIVGCSLFLLLGCNVAREAQTAVVAQRRILLEDVGIKTLAGFSPLIEHGTVLPATFSDDFSTGADNQVQVELEFSARDPEGGQVRHLSTFLIDGIEPAPRGMPRIQVSVGIAESGAVSVSATHRATGRTKEAPLDSVRTGVR